MTYLTLIDGGKGEPWEKIQPRQIKRVMQS